MITNSHFHPQGEAKSFLTIGAEQTARANQWAKGERRQATGKNFQGQT
jgi:hypothetical protein